MSKNVQNQKAITVAPNTSMPIDPNRLRQAILGRGKRLDDTAKEIGFSSNYLNNAICEKQISRAGMYSIAGYGIAYEEYAPLLEDEKVCDEAVVSNEVTAPAIKAEDLTKAIREAIVAERESFLAELKNVLMEVL